jgi:hypothetical protein
MANRARVATPAFFVHDKLKQARRPTGVANYGAPRTPTCVQTAGKFQAERTITRQLS